MLVLACSMALARPNAVAAEQTDILSMLPDNSLAFVVVNDPALLLKKASTLSKRLEVPMPDPMMLLQSQLPAIAHVDMTRPAAVAIHPGGMPVGGVILLPVKDFEAFAKACGAEDTDTDLVKVMFAGDGMVAASYKGYALLSDASDASVIEAVRNNTGKVAEQYAAMHERMQSADITGGATRAGIETFSALAKQGIVAMQAEFEKLDPEQMPGMPPKNLAEAMSVYTVLIEEFAATVQTYAFAVNIEKNAITGVDILRLKKCELATQFGRIEPSDTDWYELLPAGRPVVVGAGTTPKSLIQGMLEASKKMMTAMSGIYGMDEEQISQLFEDSKPLMEKLNGMAFLMAVTQKEDAPLYAGAGGLFKVDGGAEKYLDEYTKVITKMARTMKQSSGDSMLKFTAPKKIEVDGKPGIRISVGFNFSFGQKDSQQQKMMGEMMKKMYGPDGKLKMFLVAANDDTVAIGYTSLATVKRFIAAANGELPRTLGSMPGYKALKTHLPDDAQWTGAIDLGGSFQLIQRMVEPGMIPDLDLPAAPIGFAVTASEQEVSMHGAVTVNTVKRLVQAIQKVMSANAPTQPVAPEAVPAPAEEVPLDQ